MRRQFQKLVEDFDPDTPAVAIDFETFYSSDYSVAKRSYWAYTHDGRFDAYLVSIHGEGIHYVGHPKDAPWDRINGMLWLSHNRPFDEHVYLRLVELGVVPDVDHHAWCDTADLCRYLKVPASLGKAASYLLNYVLDKGVRDDMKDRRFADLDPETRERWIRYADLDAVACYDIWVGYRSRWPREEILMSLHTAELVKRGVHVDRDAIESAIRELPGALLEVEGRIPWAGEPLLTPTGKQRMKGGEPQTKSPTSSVFLSRYCKDQGVPVPESTDTKDPRWHAWSEQYGDTDAARVISAMQQWRKINRTLRIAEQMRDRIRDDGRLEFTILYFGARNTGRWSGKHGDFEERPDSVNLNMLNLPKAPLVVGEKEYDVRTWFRASPGHMLAVCDLAQIEPRVLASVAENEEFLELLRGGMDPYEAHARTTMGYEDPRPLSEVDKEMRTQAKVRVLQLGYQSGPAKLKDSANAMFGMDMSLAEAKRIVSDFRAKETRIVGLWKELQAGMQRASRRAETLRMSGVDYEGADFTVTLRKGRRLEYFDLHRDRHSGDYLASSYRAGKPGKLYGGKIVENIIQAQARDVFAEGILRLEAAGYRVLWHVYDEVICEIPEGADPAPISRIMSEPPAWDPTLPVATDEPMVTEAYGKW